MGEQPEAGLVLPTVTAEPVVDVRTRECPDCHEPMDRIEFYEDDSAARPRVVWSCPECASWSE